MEQIVNDVTSTEPRIRLNLEGKPRDQETGSTETSPSWSEEDKTRIQADCLNRLRANMNGK